MSGETLDDLRLGIGMSVTIPADELPSPTSPSLLAELGRHVEREGLLAVVLAAPGRGHTLFPNGIGYGWSVPQRSSQVPQCEESPERGPGRAEGRGGQHTQEAEAGSTVGPDTLDYLIRCPPKEAPLDEFWWNNPESAPKFLRCEALWNKVEIATESFAERVFVAKRFPIGGWQKERRQA